MRAAVQHDNDDNNDHIHGAAGEGSEKLSSSNNHRHAKGREERMPSIWMPWNSEPYISIHVYIYLLFFL